MCFMRTSVNRMFFSSAPSTDSSANPRDRSKTMWRMVTVSRPLVPSVPNLTRPVGPSRSVAISLCVEYTLSRTEPASYPLTVSCSMRIFLEIRNRPAPNEPFMTMASSVSELNTEFRTVTFWQASMSIASRSVSTITPSIVQPSTAVPRMAKWPPFLR